jgi:hypothetical protein
MLFVCWIQICWNFWDISTRFWVIGEYISNFLTVRLTVHNFLGSKTAFFDKNIHRIWTRWAIIVLFFFLLKLRSMLFKLRRFSTGRNNDKPVIFPQNCLSKNHFLSTVGSKKVPCIIFVGLKMVFSNTAPKIASKRINNVVQTIYFYRSYRCVLLF